MFQATPWNSATLSLKKVTTRSPHNCPTIRTPQLEHASEIWVPTARVVGHGFSRWREGIVARKFLEATLISFPGGLNARPLPGQFPYSLMHLRQPLKRGDHFQPQLVFHGRISRSHRPGRNIRMHPTL